MHDMSVRGYGVEKHERNGGRVKNTEGETAMPIAAVVV